MTIICIIATELTQPLLALALFINLANMTVSILAFHAVMGKSINEKVLETPYQVLQYTYVIYRGTMSFDFSPGIKVISKVQHGNGKMFILKAIQHCKLVLQANYTF